MTSLQFNHPTSLLIPYKAGFFSLFLLSLVGSLPSLSICLPSTLYLLPSFHTFLNYFLDSIGVCIFTLSKVIPFLILLLVHN